VSSTSWFTAATESRSRCSRKSAKAASSSLPEPLNAAYPSPSAHSVRATQYDDASLSDGSGSSTGSALGLSVPSGCIQRTTLPASGPLEVWR
jgi:hypothetical protein